MEPMTKIHRKALDLALKELCQDLSVEEVCIHLISALILSDEDQEKLEAIPVRTAKVRELIQILKTKGDAAWQAVLDGLDETQNFLAAILRTQERNAQHDIPEVGRVESSSGKDEPDFAIKKKVTHTRSDPSSVVAVKSEIKERSRDDDKDTDNSSSSGEEDNPEQVKRSREDKEIKQFSSLLETTLRLNGKQSNGDGESPEGTADDEAVKDSKVPNSEFMIAPAAPRAPKRIGNATMTTSGRLMDRIAALRKDIMAGVGIEMLQKAYEIFDNEEGVDIEPLLVKLLGRKNFEIYGGKIWQLKFCEETVFG